MEITRISGDKLTAEQMQELRGIDDTRYVLEKILSKHWNWQQKNAEGNPVLIDMYGTQATWKLKHDILEYEEVLREIFWQQIPERVKKVSSPDEELLLVLPHSDLHFDRMEHKNPKKYLDNINDRTLDLVEKAQRFAPIDRILYANMWDYYNTDTNRRTTKGTEQINSLPEKESFKIWLKSQIELLKGLEWYAKVNGIYVSGNHDEHKLQHTGDAIDLYYSGNENVSVDNNSNARKYMDWWNTAIGFMHWHEITMKELLSTFSLEHKLRKHNLMLKGHHHTTLEQLQGILQLQGIGSPATPSEWERMKGYITVSPLIAILIDKKRGKVVQLEW